MGYFGNPKSNETMDASQAPSFVGYFKNTDVYQNLKDAGFEVKGVTIYESYNYTYQKENPTPRDYLVHPVDEKFDVFEPYTDELYYEFMIKAKKVFKKYNEDKQCNPNNLDLLFDPNDKKECYTFPNDEHAHGGYECNVTTGNWSNTCKAYYCDIGYYFDKQQDKCIKDICTEGNDDTSEGRIITWNKLTMIIAILALLF